MGEPGDSCATTSPRAVRWMVATMVALGPVFFLVVNYVVLLVGYRLLLAVTPSLFGHAGAGEVSGWAWRIALWSAPLMALSLLVLSGGHLLKAFKTGQLLDAPPGNRLTRIVSNSWEPVTVFVVAMFVLSAHLDDRARVLALAVVSALLVNLITLLRLIGRPVARALRRFDRVAEESMAEVRSCKTGHHHRWCGHLENAD